MPVHFRDISNIHAHVAQTPNRHGNPCNRARCAYKHHQSHQHLAQAVCRGKEQRIVRRLFPSPSVASVSHDICAAVSNRVPAARRARPVNITPAPAACVPQPDPGRRYNHGNAHSPPGLSDQPIHRPIGDPIKLQPAPAHRPPLQLAPAHRPPLCAPASTGPSATPLCSS